jgi:hypothetical protein
MSTLSLLPVRYYNETDIYDVSVDNRPLYDIVSNLQLLNNQLGNLGFYIEAKANPETEPVGGFTKNTCACVKENSLLFPIDITKSVVEIDYSKYPIVLILSKDSITGIYKCLSFSILYKVSEKAQAFLKSSIGNTLKVGFGGTLTDYFYFNQYCGGKGYQDITVGKILSTAEITFGGNQVGVLSDNNFLQKNYNDSTSGLVSVVRDNKESTVVLKTININTVNSPYVFAEYQSSSKPQFATTQSAVPIFFTNNDLVYNQVTGEFLDLDLNSKLNEVHFKSPTVTSSSSQDDIYNSAGITVGSLLDFAKNNLIHSANFSNAIPEIEQTVSTSLNFRFSDNNALTLINNFPGIIRSIGNSVDQTTGITSSLLPTLGTTPISGLTFGEYSDYGLGVYVGLIKDNPTGITRPTEDDEQALAESTGFKTVTMTNLSNSSTFLIHAKSGSDSLSNLTLVADGYVILSGANGVHVLKQPKLDSELVNKKYADTLFKSVADTTVQKVSLAGTSDGNAISGFFEFNTTALTDSSTVLKFNTLGTTDIYSSSPIRLIDSTDTPQLQVLRIYTNSSTLPTDSGWNAADVINKGFLKFYVDAAIVSSAITPMVTVSGSVLQNITGPKAFTQFVTINDTTNHGRFLSIDSNSSNVFIDTSASYINLVDTSDFLSLADDSTPSVKLRTGATTGSDDTYVVTSKGYVDSAVAQVRSINHDIWGNWTLKAAGEGGIISNAAPDNSSYDFNTYLVSIAQDGVFKALQDCNVHVTMHATLHGADYSVIIALKQQGKVIARAMGGASTTAKGSVPGYWTLSIDTIASLALDETLEFVFEKDSADKSTGSITDLSTYGTMMVLR